MNILLWVLQIAVAFLKSIRLVRRHGLAGGSCGLRAVRGMNAEYAKQSGEVT